MKNKVRTPASRCEVRTVSLPRSTWDAVDAVTAHGGRSDFIDKAILAALSKQEPKK